MSLPAQHLVETVHLVSARHQRRPSHAQGDVQGIQRDQERDQEHAPAGTRAGSGTVATGCGSIVAASYTASIDAPVLSWVRYVVRYPASSSPAGTSR